MANRMDDGLSRKRRHTCYLATLAKRRLPGKVALRLAAIENENNDLGMRAKKFMTNTSMPFGSTGRRLPMLKICRRETAARLSQRRYKQRSLR